MSARIRDGWLELDCDAPDLVVVEVAVGNGDFRPAFRDRTPDGRRVAKIRPPANMPAGKARIRVNGVETSAGRITRG